VTIASAIEPSCSGLADQASALHVAESLGGERLGGDVGHVRSGVPGDALRLGRPTVKPAQGGQGGVDRRWLLTFAELGLVLAEIAGGGVQQWGLVALGEPGGEPLQVGNVLAGGAFADLRVIGQEGQKGDQRIIRQNRGALWDCSRADPRRAAGQ